MSLYFRPNNFHCVHVDSKARKEQKKAVHNLAKCYLSIAKNGEIFTIPENESVSENWGGNTMLKADKKCLEMLVQYKKDSSISWSHSASIAGSKLPVSTSSTFKNRINEQLGEHYSAVESFLLTQNNFFRMTETRMQYQKRLPNETDNDVF